ncbi:MAG: preprotein translocase subunit SecG [Planctomycetes bacterium]|jgi:preprotein translocase subunit SecG|nr:preprotein translocase subunit SecG [Planctomycetota bacterium]
MTLLTPLLYILFVLSAIILVVVILLQEGKGGGFSDALGAAGQQTFGVKAAGIHKFTMAVAILFFASALGIHILNKGASQGDGGLSINAPDDE